MTTITTVAPPTGSEVMSFFKKAIRRSPAMAAISGWIRCFKVTGFSQYVGSERVYTLYVQDGGVYAIGTKSMKLVYIP